MIWGSLSMASYKVAAPGSLAASVAVGALLLSFAAVAPAQMAPPLRISPAIQEILNGDPAYPDALKSFRDAVLSPDAGEKITPYDYQLMALLAFQGVGEKAVKVFDALSTIILMHEHCPDVATRRKISNAAKDIARLRPEQTKAVIEALVVMRDRESSESVRSYIVESIAGLQERNPPLLEKN